MVDFPTEAVETIPPEDVQKRALAEDRDRFLKRVTARLELDVEHLQQIYTGNAQASPLGTQSARHETLGRVGRASYLGVPPVEPALELPPRPRDVDYVDDLPTGFGDSDPDIALSRIFWRGDLPRTCAMATSNGAQTLNDLKQECVRDAADGGDPESCTACVALAELLVPACVFGELGFEGIGDSKCSLANVGSTVGLPAWWFDADARKFGLGASLEPPFDNQAYHHCAPSSYIAFDWCTDTTNVPIGSFLSHAYDLNDYVEADHIDCAGGVRQSYGVFTNRHAEILLETSNSYGRPWMIPMVTAFEGTVTCKTQNLI